MSRAMVKLLIMVVIIDTIIVGVSSNQTKEPPCESSTETRNMLFSLFCIIVMLTGIVGNSLSIFVILSSRRLRSNVANSFIVSLAMADMGVSFFITTIKVEMYVNNGNFCHSLEVCYFTTFLDYIFPMASITHLLVIAIDRFAAIIMPFMYSSCFTHRHAKLIILCAWLYVATWAGLGMFPWTSNSTKMQIIRMGKGRFCYNSNKEYATTLAIIMYFIPMVISTYLYCIIVYIATRQATAINMQKPASIRQQKNTSKRNRRLKSDLRAAKTISVVFAAYTICWLPHFITILIGYWDINAMLDFYHDRPVAYDCVTTLFNNVLPTINSCINPFIYFLLGKNFRLAFKDILYKFLNKPRDGIIYPDESTLYDKNLQQTYATTNGLSPMTNGNLYILSKEESNTNGDKVIHSSGCTPCNEKVPTTLKTSVIYGEEQTNGKCSRL